MQQLLDSNESDFDFASKANECSKRATNDWEQHFRDRFMANGETCSMILDPKFRGECLGVNLNFLFFGDLLSWVPYFWRERVLTKIESLQQDMLDFARKLLEVHAKAIEAKYSSPADSGVRMQQYTLLQVIFSDSYYFQRLIPL